MAQSFTPARSIDEVIERLDEIIESCIRRQSRLAYFPTLYRDVTLNVKYGIERNHFEDGSRMERLDVNFANRYLQANHRFRNQYELSHSWSTAFTAGDSWNLLILQHLLLGINAHINYDLGIAAAQTCPGDALPALKGDFDEITALLGDMLDDVQSRITEVSPWMGLLDRVGARTDEQIFSFALGSARDLAWRTAERFAVLNKNDTQTELNRLDRTVASLAQPIRRPGPWISTALFVMRIRESGDVGQVVRTLDKQ